MPRLLLLAVCLGLAQQAPGQLRNGFDLSDSLIDPGEILRGGPPRDGIPAIDAPRFVAAGEAAFLDPDDRVIGVVRTGIAKAYPIRILDWHEVVNDEFGGLATLVTYCPLCRTGMVFDVDGRDLTFGVSGLLYNSDVLLYDRETESLWSQIMSRAVTGPLRGEPLTLLPSRHTTWARWLEQHPDTLVLSTDTGFARDYRSSPYIGYERSDRLMFEVGETSDAYAAKSLVLGVTIGGRHKAYPFDELEAHGLERFDDEFAGQALSIVWSPESRSAYALDETGAELPTVTAYWFAWFAFHPDTEIFTADRGPARR